MTCNVIQEHVGYINTSWDWYESNGITEMSLLIRTKRTEVQDEVKNERKRKKNKSLEEANQVSKVRVNVIPVRFHEHVGSYIERKVYTVTEKM